MRYRNIIQCDMPAYNPVEDLEVHYGPVLITGFFILLTLIIVSGILLYKVYKDMDKKEKEKEKIEHVTDMNNESIVEQERETYNDGPVVSFGGTDNNNFSGTTIDGSDNQV